jgi:hypothetical protein
MILEALTLNCASNLGFEEFIQEKIDGKKSRYHVLLNVLSLNSFIYFRLRASDGDDDYPLQFLISGL